MRPLRMMYAAQQGPRRGSEQQPDPAQLVEGHRQCPGDEQHPSPGRDDGQVVQRPAREHRGEHQRAEELHRHRDPERQVGERPVEAPVHQAQRHPEGHDREPVLSAVPAQGRAGQREQDQGRERDPQQHRPAAPTSGTSVAASAPPNCTETTPPNTSSGAGTEDLEHCALCPSHAQSLNSPSGVFLPHARRPGFHARPTTPTGGFVYAGTRPDVRRTPRSGIRRTRTPARRC